MTFHFYHFLFITSLFSLNFANAQIFVDDVERVGIVTIDYCVDNSGKRYDININQEKSTYKDEGWQLGCLDHFKKGYLAYPQKMINECWQSVYYFVNSKYKTHELPKEDYVKCKAFHRGKFKYESPAFSDSVIKRRKKRQIETGENISGGRQVYKINWISDHEYTLDTRRMSLIKDKHKVGNFINVEIIEVINDNTYLYKAFIKDKENDDIVFGLITKISN
ncbi:hypothetical protein [Winogradskyella haliclonae]|uniref:Secreted protein n=1 Tax=Winogradskyella haliclonae TaxID=2048558 RepID=A0ABQ2C2Z3_9FLAO|nr:hypothetical protein [Winogradskyella haliclonae]GGI57488.1 hypothetical protein GCM10011444_17970 [Winogradskyella haliclonae]